MAYLTEMERERRRREAARRGLAFDADRDPSYSPSEDELRWLDREETREDDERSGAPSPEEREVLDDDGVYEDEPLPDESERYLPGSKGGSSSKGTEPPVVEDETGAGFDADAYFGALDTPDEPARDIPPPPANPFDEPDMTLSEDDVAALDAANRATEELPPPGEAYALDLGDPIDPPGAEGRGNPGEGDIDMGTWSRMPNDPDDAMPTEEDFARAAAEAPPDDPEAMAAFDAEMGEESDLPDMGTIGSMTDHNPMETSAEALEGPEASEDVALAPEAAPDWRVPAPVLEGMAPLDFFASEESDAPVGSPEGLARADDFWGDFDQRTQEDFGNEYSTGSEVLPMEVSPEARAVMAHAEPDADEMGGPSDMDADDLEERSAELPASTTKSTPYDRPLEEPDFTGADWSDALRRPLHALGAGLLAASGRGSASPFRSEREALEARIRERNTAKGAATEAFAGREARSADRAADRMSREAMAADRVSATREATAARTATSDRRLDQGDRRLDITEAEAGSRTAERASRMTEREEGSDPDSDVSERARARIPAMLNGLPPELRSEVEPLLVGDDAPRWAADDVEALERMPATAWRAWLTRRRGLGGTGPGGGGAVGGDVATLAEALRARGDTISDEEAAALGTTGLRRRLTAVLGSTGEAEIIDGVYGDAALVGSPTSVERRNLRGGLITMRLASRALDTLSDVRSDFGPMGILPEARGRAASAIRQLMAYSTALGETGIISPGEVESIRSELPDPANLTNLTLGGFDGSIEGWRDSIIARAEANLEARGVSADGIERALGWIRTGDFGGGSGGGSTGGGSVTIIDPDSGEPTEITAEQWAAIQADPELRDLVEMAR